jgi:hypothetical protein
MAKKALGLHTGIRWNQGYDITKIGFENFDEVTSMEDGGHNATCGRFRVSN